MLEHIAQYLGERKINDTSISIAFEKALENAFKKHCIEKHKRKIKFPVSQRGKKTYIFACANKEDYMSIIYDSRVCV